MLFPECEQFRGRKKQICRGEAGVELSNQWRSKRWGLPPIALTAGGGTVPSNPSDPTSLPTIVIPPQPVSQALFRGPGTVLKDIFAELGQTYAPDATCPCAETAALMDSLGPEGCEQHAAVLTERLLASAATLTAVETARLAWRALIKGYAFDLSAAGLLRLAIKRSREERDKHQAKATTMRWSYGVTTTLERRHTLLPKTLASLAAAGFDDPLIGVDGCDQCETYRELGRMFTTRKYLGNNFANWFLTALEVYLRDPFAERYAMFEDDFLISAGAKAYLEQTTGDPRAYYNLFTRPETQQRVKPDYTGWFLTNQEGFGAVALVFSQTAFRALLCEPGMLLHPKNQQMNPNKKFGQLARGKEYVDGCIVSALSHHGILEFCHSPSIVQHVGMDSSSGHRQYPQATTFRGEEFDLRSLLKA